jgi:hypothetical protein
MAQMKPNSSRPTGDDLWFLKRAHELSSKLRRDAGLPAAASFLQRVCSAPAIKEAANPQAHAPGQPR